MIREIIRPSENFIHIPIPKEYINKNIEVLIFDIDEPIKKEKSTAKLLKEFRRISDNISKVDKNINIIGLEEDINSDIF
jgi:hypothetical protein